MAPTIHCVRHAQGIHNVATGNYTMIDPRLTSLGEEQCAALRDSFPNHDKIALLIASPLRRTIHTALLAFAPALANGRCHPEVVALPEMQETSDYPCDTGSDIDKLRAETDAENLPVDLSLVKEGWNIKTSEGKWAPTFEALNRRAIEARKFIRDKILELQKGGEQDPEIIVTSHGGFLHYFTEDWEDSKAYNGCLNKKVDQLLWAVPGTGWRNAEYRSFTFTELCPSCSPDLTDCTICDNNNHVDDYENASLRETAKSRSRRGKAELQHGREAQVELFSAAMRGWEEQGLQKQEKIGKEREWKTKGVVKVITNDGEEDRTNGEAVTMDDKGEAAADVATKGRRSSLCAAAVAA